MLLVVELLGRCSGGYQRVETGNRATGDRDEQRREQISLRLVIEACEGRHLGDARVRTEDPDDRKRHHEIQQEGAQVVSGLEQDPDRNDGCSRDVHTDQHHPRAVIQVNRMPVQPDRDDGCNRHDTGNRGHQERCVSSVDHEAEHNGNDDEQNRNHRGRRVGRACRLVQNSVRIGCAEGSGNHGRECCDDQKQGQVGKDQKQLLHLAAHGISDDLSDRLALVAQRSKQRAEIVDASEENSSDQNPEHHRHPAEYGRLDRSGNRACPRDGREMMSHQHRCL